MVAMKCRDRLHELVKEEIEKKDSSTEEWKIAMESSFNRMDNEVILCELDQFLGYQTHQCSDSPGFYPFGRRNSSSGLSIASIHGAVLALAACVLSVPYDMPSDKGSRLEAIATGMLDASLSWKKITNCLMSKSGKVWGWAQRCLHETRSSLVNTNVGF
ncbi:unnamed protein product [Camellia sinensis]